MTPLSPWRAIGNDSVAFSGGESKIDDAQNWAIIYTHNRDSGLLDQSNAHFIRTQITPFAEGDDPDVVFESHDHWLVGHVDGFSIRVFRDSDITEPFKIYHELAERMSNYPGLDEDDYSNREYEATLENIRSIGMPFTYHFHLPEGWEDEVYSWLAEASPHSIESTDDQGGHPGEGDIKMAIMGLGYTECDQ